MRNKHTIYKQFNAGENKLEVQNSINQIKALGCRGVLLVDRILDFEFVLASVKLFIDGVLDKHVQQWVLGDYAREVLVGENSDAARDEKAAMAEIQMWMDGTLQTVDHRPSG
jgi:hypothetical protein